MPRSATRKPTLRQPTVHKKTVRKRKVTVRKKAARKKIVHKNQASKRKAMTRKPVLRKAIASKAARRKVMASDVTASKARVPKPAESRDRMDRVEATVEKLGINLDKLSIEVKETVAGIRELRKSIGGLDGKWGNFSEALLIGDVEKALNEFEGIAVTSRHPNPEFNYEGNTWEIDCLATGDDMVVVIEAKASLTKGHVGKFIGNVLERFTLMAPIYRGKKIYGAVGYLNAKDGAVTFAQSKGLLVLRSVHKTKEIVSVPSKFKLHNFHP